MFVNIDSDVSCNVQTAGVAPDATAAVAVVQASSNELLFHRCHGRNAIVSADGRTAARSSARGEFNDGIVISCRALRDDELFQVRLSRMVERWSGSLEVGTFQTIHRLFSIQKFTRH